MEAASLGAGVQNHLKNVLSEEEFATLSQPITTKINGYIEQTFEEYLTSKALHETSKSKIDDKIAESDSKTLELTVKYEEASTKLIAVQATASELTKHLENLKQELEKDREKICRLENEAISLKSARDAAIDERNELARIVERRDAEAERLTAAHASLAQQLQSAIDAKCEALALNDEIQSKELALEYREKRIEQERVLLNSQIAGLTEEVNKLTSELQTLRLNNTSRLVSLETQLAEKTEELNTANETIDQLNEVQKKLNSKAENLSKRLMEQREMENKISENYKKELDAKSKLADIFKTMHDDADAKTAELTEGIAELQRLLTEATEKYGDIETKLKQAEKDHEEIIEKKNEIISSLKTELEHANDLLKAANAHNLDMALSDIAPSAAAASKLLKSGMSLTQVYSQLVKVTEELAQEKEENRRLNSTINTIVQELEDKAPLLQKQRAEYEEVLETNTALTQQIESLMIECNRLRDDYSESSKIANHFSRENSRLKGELADLGRQVCFLLKEIEQSRGGSMPNGEHDDSMNASDAGINSSHVISKTLVTFSDIQELQNNNQKLLRMVRDLTEKQEEFERHKAEFESGELQSKIEALKNRVTELTEAQDRQTKMVNGLIRQRDMFKKLYHDQMKGKRSNSLIDADADNSDNAMDTSREKLNKTLVEPTVLEVKYKETEKHLQLLKEEYKTYKEEKSANEKILLDQIDNMRQEISKLTASNSKCASTSEYNNERLKILQTNITTYKKQITALEEKNKVYSNTIAKHEVALQHLRDEALNAQSKCAAAEITIENLKLEVKLLKDTELRLQTEKDVLNRERQGQALLLKNLELIKVSLERVEVENHNRLESRLDEATRECAALRRRLQEEQDRFRELSSHLERQTELSKSRMQEEKDAADVLRKDIAELRQNIAEKNKTNDELAKKLKVALAPNSDGSFDSIKRIKELENKLMDKDSEIKSLQEQLEVAKQHIKQYCEISECAENELKVTATAYETYKSETEKKLADYAENLQKLQERCSELEAELSIQAGGEISGHDYASKTELNKTKEELNIALKNYETCNADLQQARAEMSHLSQVAQNAEEKYAHEMVLHSNDIQTLTQVKEELFKAQNQLNELIALKNTAEEKLEAEKSAWAEREKMITSENEQLMQRFKDLNEQNSLLHDQIQALGTQLSVSHASRSQSESMMNESKDDSNVNVSICEEDGKSSDQLFKIVKFLRKEKDIAMAKFEILQAETMRLKSQLEVTEKKLDDAKLALAADRENSEVNMVTFNKQSDILRKVETLNALTDSNRILREERDALTARVEELEASNKSLDEALTPLKAKIAELTAKTDTLQSENTALKADSARWRTRVNALVERANKTSPEDWKRLQNERETLAKMLTLEKENVTKLTEELSQIKTEKCKLEEQYTILSRQQNTLLEENKRMCEEIQTLKDDMSRLTEELTKVKAELAAAAENNIKTSEELATKEASLNDIRNKELQIRKIAKKYKLQYEELVKTVEEDKKKSEGEVAAAETATAETTKKMEDEVGQLQAQLEAEKANNEKIKQELESIRNANLDRDDKAKQVLKTARMKIVQLTEAKNNLSRELDESRARLEAIEQSTRDEQDVRLAVIKSQYEGRLTRLEKERGEAQAEKTREVEALQQKVNMLQRQLASQASASKQQTTAEKNTTEPPTANIKPMAGVPGAGREAARRGGETPLASIRPMAQVGPTAPHDAHSTEYMPASSSRPLPRQTVTASNAPPESTQDMDTSEAAMGSSAASSDSTAQSSSHSQAPQQAVALVLPRIEQPSVVAGASSSAAVSSAPASTSAPQPDASAPPTHNPAEAESVVGGVEPQTGVVTSQAPEPRAAKRPRLQQRPAPHPKRTRVQQGFERSVEVEYQVPTSSRCDQDDDGVIVVDSEEDDERCTGTMYREGEEEEEEEDSEEEMEEEQEAEAEAGEDDVPPPPGNADAQQESPAQSPAAAAEPEPEPARPQIETISSAPEPSGALSLGGGGDDADDSIVPSTPTLYVPRRNDGFGEAVVSPVGEAGGSGAGGAAGAGAGGAGAGAGGGARFTFADAGAASHHDTCPDLAPHTHNSTGSGVAAGGEAGDRRGEDDAPPTSSQGSQPPSPTQMGVEEGREAEASSPMALRRGPPRAVSSPHSNQLRWHSADSESGARGRGMRARGRPPRRPFMRY